MGTETKTKRVKKVFSNMYDIAHIFANEPGRDCKFGNGFVENDVIYSYNYHFPIAKRYIDKKGKVTIFFTLDTYSNTTAKHIRNVSAATIQLDRLYMYNVPRYDETNHGNNISYWIGKIKECLQKASKARENKSWIISEAHGHVQKLQKYMEFFKLKADKEIKKVVADALDDKWQREIEEYNKKKAEKEADPFIEEKREKARLAREKAELKKNAEQIVKWRNFEVNSPYLEVSKRMRWSSTYRNLPDLLRYDPMKERVQTSQRVEIPVEAAKKFYRYIQVILAKGGCNSEECCNYKLLDTYNVTEITEEHIKVGCHTIKMDEVHNMARSLEWINW